MANGTFYTISKRNNSTLVPTGTGVTLDIELKNSESLLHPRFRLSLASRPAWNYVQYEGRYYFIRDIVSVRNNLWDLFCDVDVLATYKANIQATTPYVLYASGSNSEIIDRRISIKTTPTYATGGGVGFPHVTALGKYVLTIVGTDSTASYVCSFDDVRRLLGSISEWYHESIPLPSFEPDIPTPSQETDIVAQLKQACDALVDGATQIIDQIKDAGQTIIMGLRQLVATGDAGDNIKSATFIPLSDGAFSGKTSSRRVYMGEYDTGIDLPAITDRHFAESISFTIPWQASGWRRNAPYHGLYLVVPTLGLISLPVADLIDCSTLNVELSMDLITGDAKIIVYAGNLNRQIGIYGVNYGAQYPIGASNTTPVSLATTILGGAAAAATAYASGGAAAFATGAGWLAGTLNNSDGTPTCVGGNGGSAAIGADVRIWLYSIYHDTIVNPDSLSAVMGVPVMRPMSLANHSGYVETQNASVSGSMTSEERQLINNMMDGGIYIE
jgi:hypothetical protein